MTQTTSLWRSMVEYSSVFLRVSLGVSFLSAVADRCGMWGAYGQPNVAWGEFSRFVAYTAKLNWYVPAQAAWGLAWVVTVAETVLGVLLLVGLYARMAALLSGVLLLLFALSMALALGLKAPLNFSVFSASAGALLLSVCDRFPWSLDAMRASRQSLHYANL
jgi:uncharacterized membrane protein YphA (DoxX/SURF4 family)